MFQDWWLMIDDKWLITDVWSLVIHDWRMMIDNWGGNDCKWWFDDWCFMTDWWLMACDWWWIDDCWLLIENWYLMLDDGDDHHDDDDDDDDDVSYITGGSPTGWILHVGTICSTTLASLQSVTPWVSEPHPACQRRSRHPPPKHFVNTFSEDQHLHLCWCQTCPSCTFHTKLKLALSISESINSSCCHLPTFSSPNSISSPVTLLATLLTLFRKRLPDSCVCEIQGPGPCFQNGDTNRPQAFGQWYLDSSSGQVIQTLACLNRTARMSATRTGHTV